MEKRDPFRDVANTSSSSESQELADDAPKQPEAVADTSSANKENGFAQNTQNPNTDKPDLGCGSSKSKESKPRRSVLKIFDPLYSDSPEKVIAEPKPGKKRPQLIIEYSDESETSRQSHSPEVSDDDETSFVDACTATEETPNNNPIPETRSVELEETLLNFFTPDKVHVARKDSDSEPVSTSDVAESKPVLVNVEIPTSAPDQAHLQEEAVPSTSRTPDVTESEIFSAINKQVSSDSDTVLIRSKFTITKSELENINLVRERFCPDDRNASVRTRQESAADAIEPNSLTSVSEIRNISPERSVVSFESETANIEPSPEEEQPANQVSVVTDTAEREELCEDSQEWKTAVIDNPIPQNLEEREDDSPQGISQNPTISVSSNEEPLVLTETESLESLRSSKQGASGYTSELEEQKISVDETKKSHPGSVLVKFEVILQKTQVPTSHSEDKKSETETESEESVEEESERESGKDHSEKDKDPDPEPEPEEQQPENSEFSKDSESPSEGQEKDSENKPDDKQSKTQDSQEEAPTEKVQELLESTFEVEATPEQIPEKSQVHLEPDHEAKPEEAQEFEKADSEEIEKSGIPEEKTKSTDQSASNVKAEETTAPSESPAPTEETEQRAEETDSTSESQKPAEDAKEADASSYIHQDEEHHLDSGVHSIEESFAKNSKIQIDDLESGGKEDGQVKETIPLPEKKIDEVTEELKTEIVDQAAQDEQPQLVDEPAEAHVEQDTELIDAPAEPEVDKPVANLTDNQKSDIISFKARMADLSEKLSEQQQENSDLKLQLNAIQQAKASLELEIRQKEEVIIKTQAEALKNEQTFKQEIKQLREKLKENSKLIEKDGSKELEEQLKEAKAREAKAVAELNQRTKDDLNYQKIMEEYENTIATRFADYQKLKEEHETATRHLANIELAFSDVHQKYERSKALLEGFKSNEEALNAALQASEKTFKQHEERYESLKAHAKGQIEKSNKEILMLRDKYETDISKLKAIIKRLEIKCSSLEVSLQQKTEECAALSALCDEVTGKKV